MPKTKNTRRLRAVALLNDLSRGPLFSDLAKAKYKPVDATRQYRLWAEDRIKELCALVPELRGVNPEWETVPCGNLACRGRRTTGRGFDVTRRRSEFGMPWCSECFAK